MTTRSTCSACTASAASIGMILTGVFAIAALSIDPRHARTACPACSKAIPARCSLSSSASLVTIAWSGVVTFVILKVIGFVTALRVTPEAEQMGLDISLHGESIHS